ncbi:MAG: hypothetical protein MJ247_03015 [Alphaproteobacteria bacterium]|nr:hypothetical protein [Alphaproteobacteria bacterium]
MPQFDTTCFSTQIFWMLVTFTAMFLVVWKVALPLLKATVDARQNQLEKLIKQTEDLKSEAELCQKEYDATNEQKHEKCAEIVKAAQEEINATVKKAQEEFNAKLEKQIKENEEKLASLKNDALKEVSSVTEELTELLIKKCANISIQKSDISNKVQSISGDIL